MEHLPRRCLSLPKGEADTERAAAVWDTALAAEWRGTPVWFHGDIASAISSSTTTAG